MNDLEKRKYIDYLSLKGELAGVEERGTSLYLDGKKTDADFIASMCVFNENSDYMRDYVTGKGGSLDAISFDRVRSEYR